VEGGAAISDHAYRQPAGLTIRAAVSDSSMRGLAPDYAVAVGRQGRLTDSDSSDSAEFYARLLELQRAREPFDIVTGKRLYKNMLLTRLSTVTDAASENILSFTAECREVIIVETRLAAVPPARLHQDPPRTGRAKDRGQVQSKEVGSSVINKMFG
jgi:hypothetical protein